MRKGIDGLCGCVRHLLQEDPLSRAVYIFFNKPCDKVKLLVWDHDGYVLYQKRLERGRFEVPDANDRSIKISMRYDHLVMLISGISLKNLVQKKRYSLSTN